MTSSPLQTRIYYWIEHGTGHGSMRSAAGSGKTTTLVGVTTRTPRTSSVVALAFARRNADDLKDRMPFWAKCDTHHAFCNNALNRHFRQKPKPEAKKESYIMRDLVPEWKRRVALEEMVLPLVALAKANAYGCGCEAHVDEHGLPEWTQDLSALADHYGLDASTDALAYAEDVLRISLEQTHRYSFDDMLWLSLRHKVCFDKANWLLVDEAQDLNFTQQLLLPQMLAEDGRLLIVGDPFQSIYGFRGASPDAMERMEVRFNMEVMPLSVSYRCSKSVVAEAQRVLSQKIPGAARTTKAFNPIDQDEDIDPITFDECEERRALEEPL